MTPYEQVEKSFRRLARLNHLGAIASWDQAVMMPSGGIEARSQAMGELAMLQVEILCSKELDAALKEAEGATKTLSNWQLANLREARARQRRATAVDPLLVEKITALAMQCEHAWRTLRKANNWAEFAPRLKALLELAREESRQRAKATGLAPYEALLDLYEPGLKVTTVERVFRELKSVLPGLTEKILERQARQRPIGLGRKVPVAKQKGMMKEFMNWLGFDFDHGRLDESHHPFCGGVPEDVRLTTRYSEDEFLSGLLGVLHETGHARYEQGLPRLWTEQPVGSARGMAMHESQSLFVEMQIGRSREFAQFAAPLLRQHLAEANDPDGYWQADNLFCLSSRVERGLIRVEADEVTYPAHVILRFEIERAMIEGELEIGDLPGVWNEKMQDYLGLTTFGNDRDGCMQDVHWPSGSFGYFPSYTLGALIAAQLFWAYQKKHPNVRENLARGELAPVMTWLSENIWQQGSRLPTEELLREATGEGLSVRPFLAHLEGRYLTAD